ncbi:DUF2199 domain-containing protein [Streptomyces sp. NPDC049837]|uniref:DUF2199 domain-containing protein n=1 Tax=Streptomyces sp. NPDC049837 TaxID=3155277 RepID=UPI00344A6FF0
MTSQHHTSCSCCGEPLADERRVDVRFRLPDAALTVPEEARHDAGPSALRLDGGGCYLRVLLPVRLTGGTELVLGTWLEVDDATLARAHAVWEDPAYAALSLRGALANAVRPWGEALLGAHVTAEVRDPDELPYVTASDHPLAARVVTRTWDRDEVLSRFAHPLPLSVRTSLDERWSIERTAGLTARFADGTDHFADPVRSVAVNVFEDDTPGRAPSDFLAALLAGAPAAPESQRLTEPLPDGQRHAFWLTPAEHGRERHELYGFAAHADGTAVGTFCTFEAADDLAWALHTWRSLQHTA